MEIEAAIVHTVEPPLDNRIFLRVEYPTVEDAKTFRERLLASGVLDRFPPALPPTVAELAEEVTY